MKELLKKLCLLNAPSGNEEAVREFIIDEIKDYCQYSVDALGNIIAFKKGKNQAKNKVLVDAHMDEVGFIVTNITNDGFIKFSTVGGISVSALLAKRVVIGKTVGVVGCKPAHFCKGEEAKKAPDESELYIDIGALDKTEAEKYVNIGDFGTFESDFVCLGDMVKAKAIDDRAGCAVIISLLKEENDYDFYASFSVQEEIGLRGARTAAFAVEPEFAVCIDATTASDISGVDKEKWVCKCGSGPAVSFMDRATLYEKELYNAAINSGITAQPKAFVSGGNNAGAVHLSKSGVRTLALSLPCRYIHSSACVASIKDLENLKALSKKMLNDMAAGVFKK